MTGRTALVAGLAVAAVLAAVAVIAPVAMFASSGFMAMQSESCTTGASGAASPGAASQPAVSASARASIPARYLADFRASGTAYGVPWVILAGIGEVESDDGRAALPGIDSGSNAFGAAGPMQIGIGGAAGNTWGGAPEHPADEEVSGVATDADGDGVASVYEPADAVAGAAKYLLAHGVLDDPSQAVFAYNHLASYVQEVLHWADVYASGGYTVSTGTPGSSPGCLVSAGKAASAAAQEAISYAAQQIGKPYVWGATGPDTFDCSGLVMMAYRAAGVTIPRTSQEQYAAGPQVSPARVQPGDLVFFAGSDGTPAAPGHVGIVIGHGLMIEAYATGFPVRIAPYAGRDPVGFTRPAAGRRLAA